MASITDKIGGRLRQLRRKAGLSQAQLAQASGLAVETISRYERGMLIPSVDSLEAMARAMRFPIAVFFEDAKAEMDLPADLLKIVNQLKDQSPETIRRACRVLAAMLS